MYIFILFVLLIGVFLILKTWKNTHHQLQMHNQKVLEYNKAIELQVKRSYQFNSNYSINSEDLINFKLSILKSLVNLLTEISYHN